MSLNKLDDSRVQWVWHDGANENKWRCMSLGRAALALLLRNLALLDTIDLLDASRAALRGFIAEGAKLV